MIKNRTFMISKSRDFRDIIVQASLTKYMTWQFKKKQIKERKWRCSRIIMKYLQFLRLVPLLLIFVSSNLTLINHRIVWHFAKRIFNGLSGTNHENNTNHISIQHTIKVILCQIFGIIFVTPILRITVNFMGQWDIEKL